MKSLYIISQIFILSFIVSQVSAAEIIQVNADQCALVLSGPITSGDTQRVEAALSKTNDQSICLNSTGGSYKEGRNLYEYFMENGIKTYIHKSSECHSACALAFLGGSEWGDYRHPARSMEPGAILGFHAPYLTLPKGNYSANTVAQTARSSIEIVKKLIEDQQSLKISKWFLTNFLLFDSTETRSVATISDAAHAGIDLAMTPQTVSFTDASLKNACKLLFSKHEEYFFDSYTAQSPWYALDNGNLHKTQFFDINVKGEKLRATSTVSDPDTTGQTASCAFATNASMNGNIYARLWSNGVGEISNLDTALQLINTEIPWWYFLDAKKEISDLATAR